MALQKIELQVMMIVTIKGEEKRWRNDTDVGDQSKKKTMKVVMLIVPFWIRDREEVNRQERKKNGSQYTLTCAFFYNQVKINNNK